MGEPHTVQRARIAGIDGERLIQVGDGVLDVPLGTTRGIRDCCRLTPVQLQFLMAELVHAAEEGLGASGITGGLRLGGTPLITHERHRFFEDFGHERIIECHVGGEGAGELGSSGSLFLVAGARLGAPESPGWRRRSGNRWPAPSG
jgi:hypothetical protein